MSDSMAETVKTVLDSIPPGTISGEDVYTGENGLLYCGKCRTPVQHRIHYAGKEHIVPCLCKCGQERLEQEKAEEAERQRLMNVRRLKATGIQERHLLEWRFDTAEDNPDIRMAHRFVNNWKKVRAENLGLLLWGDVGTGKSFVAACIANALMEQSVPVLMTNFSKILNQMGAMYSEERYRYIASFSAFSLLIIDDLGIERNTEYALEQVYAVIDERYKSGLPVIITTNLMIDEIRNPPDVAHARIYSRILEMCTPVRVMGSDRRVAVGKKKQETIKEVLDL